MRLPSAPWINELPPRALDWPVIRRLLSSIDRTDRGGWRDFMMLHLMAQSGLRPGEVAHLTFKSIDWTARTLLVQQQKTRSWLTLPLKDESVSLLRRNISTTMRYAKADMDLKRQALSQVFPETLAAPVGGKMRFDGTEVTRWLKRL